MSGKAPIIKIPVEWTTGNVNNKNTCIGVFKSGVGINYCINEINNAPVDLESCTTRIFIHKNPKSVNKVFSKGYSEQAIQVTVPFSELGLVAAVENEVKWRLLNKESVNGGTVMSFSTDLKTDSNEKQE